MKELKARVQKNWRIAIILSAIILLAIMGQDIFREVIFFRNEVNELEEDLLNEVKSDLKNEVEFRIHEIDEIIQNLDQSFNEHLQHDVHHLSFSLEENYVYLDGLTITEKEDSLITIIKDYSSENGSNYSLMKIDGTLIYDGENEEKREENLFDLKDEFNKIYYQEMIDQIGSDATLPDTGCSYALLDYSGDIRQVKIMGVRLKNTDYVLFTQGDLIAFQQEVMEQYFLGLHTFYETKDKTIFAINEEHIYLQRDEQYIGMDTKDISNDLFLDTVATIVTFGEENRNGYLSFEYFKNLEDGVMGTRIAYIEYYEEMNIYVGYSSDIEEVQTIVDQFRSQTLQINLVILIPLYIGLAILIFFLIRLIVKTYFMSMDIFKEEEDLYKEFANLTEDIILITDKKGNIIFTNNLGRKTIFKEEDENLNFDDVINDEEGYKILIGANENYFVKFQISQVVYAGTECDLYIVTDVTEKVQKEQELEAMTQRDELTKLGNRRMLVKDYNEDILPKIKNGSKAYLAMIDLDNFKQANDDYGHSFGDKVLVKISKIFNEHESENLKIYRVGGDEFSLLASDISENEIMKTIRTIKNKVSTFNYGKKLDIGFSAGITEINIKDKERRLTDYYKKADKLLYEAKEEGKDRIKK